MNSNPEDDELLRGYLLGELPSQEADLLERRLLAEDDLFELCEALEADLLAASARGELAPAESERVLARLASSPQGRERLALARSLNTVADEISVAAPAGNVVPFKLPVAFPRTTFRRAALAIAAGLFAVIGVYLFIIHNTPTPSDSQYQVAKQHPAPTRPTAAPKSDGAPKGAPGSTEPADHLARKEPLPAVFTLSLATLRGGGEIEEFRIPAGTEVVEIQLFDIEALESSGPFHTVVRSKADGGTVWEGDLAPRQLNWGPVLVLKIPAERLAAGRYEVTVTAGGEEMIQGFEVVRGGRR